MPALSLPSYLLPCCILPSLCVFFVFSANAGSVCAPLQLLSDIRAEPVGCPAFTSELLPPLACLRNCCFVVLTIIFCVIELQCMRVHLARPLAQSLLVPPSFLFSPLRLLCLTAFHPCLGTTRLTSLQLSSIQVVVIMVIMAEVSWRTPRNSRVATPAVRHPLDSIRPLLLLSQKHEL